MTYGDPVFAGTFHVTTFYGIPDATVVRPCGQTLVNPLKCPVCHHKLWTKEDFHAWCPNCESTMWIIVDVEPEGTIGLSDDEWNAFSKALGL